ncbi:hypothetical protein, partial [uncultured Duncaniella sp.]|uniref:hypothetical protein n=3 Tax=uncultured Duncaniella sp. TaxID=2768039 RepID=UPI0026595695
TLTGGTRIRRATITPQGNFYFVLSLGVVLFPFDSAKVGVNSESTKFFRNFFQKKISTKPFLKASEWGF